MYFLRLGPVLNLKKGNGNGIRGLRLGVCVLQRSRVKGRGER